MKLDKLVEFLRHELALPESSIQTALRHSEPSLRSLPMVLWQYGLITLEQLDEILDWIDACSA